jgi:pimeloyl-ACP methyl ester carboxylesterase
MLPIRRCAVVAVTFLATLHAAANNIPSIVVNKAGSGKQNIIFISGLGCSSSVWDETVQALPGNTTYGISFAGFAGNEAQPNPILDRWESDILSFIDDNKIEKPILIGHSLGGTIALELAAMRPAMFRKVVIVDAFPCLPALYNPAFKAQPAMDLAPFVNQFTLMRSEQLAGMYKQMIADTSKAAMVTQWALRSDRKTMGQMYGTLMNKDLRTQLAAITCPVLVMLQPAMKVKDAEIKDSYKLLHQATITYATRGLHFIMYDDKEWYLHTLQSFLQ